jgi:hypothetical protein
MESVISALNQKNQEIYDSWEYYNDILETVANTKGMVKYEELKETIYDEVFAISERLKADFERMVGLDKSVLEYLTPIEPIVTGLNEKSIPSRFYSLFNELDFYFDSQWLTIKEQSGVERFRQEHILYSKVCKWIKHISKCLSEKPREGSWAMVIEEYERLEKKWDFKRNETDTPFTSSRYYLFDIGNIDFSSKVFYAIRSDIMKTFGGNYGILGYNCFYSYTNPLESGDEEIFYEVYNESSHSIFQVSCDSILEDYKVSVKEQKLKCFPERLISYKWYHPLNKWLEEKVDGSKA